MEYYNKFANDYYKTTGTLDAVPLCSCLVNAIKERAGGCQKSFNVLDLGCGSGRDSYYLAGLGFKVFSIDKSEKLLGLAKNAVNYDSDLFVKFLCADFLALPFKSNFFDAVLAQASLLHLPKNKLRGAFMEVKRSIKPGGFFYFSLKRGAGESFDDKGRFFSYYTDEEVITALSDTGFSVISRSDSKSLDNRDITWLGYLVSSI
ncbi:MAG: class I SAM-dependent methyltransferase [Candidatus Wallbacteria bacterium]